MVLFEVVKDYYRVYPSVLGYHYLTEVQNSPELVDEINKYDFVFIESDFSMEIPGCDAIHVMTSAEHPGTHMWLNRDYTGFNQMPHSEWTDVPVVGFVGRCPIFPEVADKHGNVFRNVLHQGFESRYLALKALEESNEICTDFHSRMLPAGDSCGFWNDTLPNYKKDGPLFKANMVGTQYQVCARGNANWSLRFYETLAYGRIPVYVESGGMTAADWYHGDIKARLDDLPFVYVNDVKDIEWEILKFHNSIDSLAEIQDACRYWYIDNYSPGAQFEAFDAIFAKEYMRK